MELLIGNQKKNYQLKNLLKRENLGKQLKRGLLKKELLKDPLKEQKEEQKFKGGVMVGEVGPPNLFFN